MRLRRIARWFGFALGAFVLLLAAAVVVLHTSLGKAWLADFAGRMLSGPETRVAIGKIEGSIFSRFTVDRVSMADKNGVWLAIERVAIDWSPSKLIVGRLEFGSLGVGRVAFARQPAPAASKSEAAGDLGASLPKISVARAVIDEIDLAKPFLGATVRLKAQGNVRLEGNGGPVSLLLSAQRIDGTAGLLRLEANYAPESKNLTLAIDAEESSGGFIAQMADTAQPLPIKLALRGTGSLANWQGRLDLSSGNDALVRATATIREQGEGHRLAIDLQAGGERFLPKAYADILAGGATARATLTFSAGSGLNIEQAEIVAAGARLDIRGRIEPRLDAVAIKYDLQATEARVARVLAPELGWRRLVVTGSIEGATANPAIKAALTIDDLVVRGNRVPTLRIEGQSRPISSNRGDQRIALSLSGNASAAVAADPRFTALLARETRLNGAATVDAAGDLTIDSLSIDFGPSSARFAGNASSDAIKGRLALDRFDLAALAAFAGLPLAGEASLTADLAGDAKGNAAFSIRGGIDMPRTGVAAIDGLLGARLEISGAVRRAADGALAVENVALRSDHLTIAAAGTANQDAAMIDARAEVKDLGKADARLTGAATLDAKLTGTIDRPNLTFALDIPNATALGRKVERISIKGGATDLTGAIAGNIQIGGAIDNKPISGHAALATQTNGDRTIQDLNIAIGSAKVTASLALSPRNRLAGRIDLDAPALADLSALALTELQGRLKAGITLTVGRDGRQEAAYDMTGANIVADGVRVETLRWRGELAAGDAPSIDTTLEVGGARAGANTVSNARIVAKGSASDLRIQINATANGAVSAIAARIEAQGRAARLRLDSFAVRGNGRELRLSAPATIRFEPDAVVIERVTLRAGAGSIAVEGRVAEAMDIRVALGRFPVEALALAVPGLDLSGSASGSIVISGAASAPSAAYDLSLAQLRNTDTHSLGAGPFAVRARGTATPQRLQIAATLTGPNLASATIDGSVPLTPAGALNLTVKGRLDVAAINPLLAIRGARVSGALNIDLTVAGSTAAPRMSGSLRLTGGRIEDAVSGFYLDRVELSATGTNDSLTIERWSAVARNGGTISGEGRVTLDPQAGLTGRLALRAQNALLVANETVNAVSNARLEFTGPLARRPRISGRMDIQSLEVTIPDRLPAAAAMIDVRHVNVPAKLRTQLPPRKQPVAAGRPGFVADLDLEISAPVRVYVRGRGVDTELGGTLSLRGTSEQPRIDGGFDMKRGRLDLFGKTLNFTRGRMTFPGTLDPALDFIASSTAGDVVATVTVSGSASDPKFVFGSTPALPQDEVLSRLFFGRPSTGLTTGQAVQLAQIAAQLSGAGGPGVLDRVRKRLGVDTLDVGTGPQGNTPQIGVGRRVSDRVYLGVRQGTTPGSSRATVDIDITRNLKIRGEAGADGSTSIGVGAEWNY